MTSQMTNEEAIKGLKKLRSFHNGSYGEHIDMAIKALEVQEQAIKEAYDKGYEYGVKEWFEKHTKAQPCIEDYPTCTECEHYDSEKHYCPRFCQVIKDTLAEAQPSEWIPVSERLPENAGVYIVSRWFSDGCESMILTDACYFDGTSTWHNDNRINHSREYVDKKIVAWMPLPEPYTEVEDGKDSDCD